MDDNDSEIFFFQAEDGIRDWSVTGVQTCALPICGMCAGMGMGVTWQSEAYLSPQQKTQLPPLLIAHF